MKREATKLQDAANLKKIAEAYNTYIERYKEPVTCIVAGNPVATLFAQTLAGYSRTTDDVILNDPSVYISSSDKYASKPGITICNLTSNGTMTYSTGNGNMSWHNTPQNPFCSSSLELLSYCIVCNLPTYAKGDTTPLAFTRGLCEDGTWHENYGLYGSEGGYVVFVDGHVRWYDGKRAARFLKWDQTGYTNDIREAIPNNAKISIGNGFESRFNDIKNESNFKMFLIASGTGGEE